MGNTKKERNDFSSLTLQKYYGNKNNDIDTWELQVRNHSNDCICDILIIGIQNEFGKCYT